MIKLGFSPCPNDTFIFYSIAKKKVTKDNLEFKIIIDDVENLNNLALNRSIDVTKVSCYAYYYLKDDYYFLRSGGAFGRDCGPLLVKRKDSIKEIEKIAIPGRFTTAFLLLRLYLYFSKPTFIVRPNFVFMPFYRIIDAIKEGMVDAGLIIHESRFVYPEYGLKEIFDLGNWWKDKTGLIIPLGGIVARRSLGRKKIRNIESLLRASVEYALNNKDEVMPFIKEHCQELSEDVIKRHIELYVNKYTVDIEKEGELALKELMRMAKMVEGFKGTFLFENQR